MHASASASVIEGMRVRTRIAAKRRIGQTTLVASGPSEKAPGGTVGHPALPAHQARFKPRDAVNLAAAESMNAPTICCRLCSVGPINGTCKKHLDANPFLTNDCAKAFASTQLTDDDRLSARVHEATERVDVDAPTLRRASPSALRHAPSLTFARVPWSGGETTLCAIAVRWSIARSTFVWKAHMTGSNVHRRVAQASISASLLLMLVACEGSTVTPTQSLEPRDARSDIEFAVATGPNAIQNPGFETQGGTGDPASWSRDWWGSPTPSFTYPVAGRDSPRAARIRYFATSTGGARYQPAAVTVAPATIWDYNEWYRSTAATNVVAQFTSGTGDVSYALLSSAASSADAWTQLSAAITIPAGITKATVFHLISAAGSLTIDDVSFSPRSAPPPPPPGGFAQGMVTIALDDAWQTQHVNALPILQAAGIKATFYLTTTPVQQGWNRFMTPAQVVDIASKGHEIGGHTLTHADLTTLSQSAIDAEVQESRTYLRNLTGAAVTTFAFPYGLRNALVNSRIAPAGYTSARTVDLPGLNDATTDKFGLRSQTLLATDALTNVTSQVDLAIARKQWLILTVHDVDIGGDLYFTTPTRFAEIVNYIKQSGVRIVTIAEGRTLMAP